MVRRGHEVTLAGNPLWRGVVEREGLAFFSRLVPEQSSDMIFFQTRKS